MLCRELGGFVTDVEGGKIGIRRRARSVKIPMTIKLISRPRLSWTQEYIPMGVTDNVTVTGDEGPRSVTLPHKIRVG